MKVFKLLFVCLGFYGCGNCIESKEELIQFYKNNSDLYVKIKRFKDTEVKVKYIPEDLLIQEKGNDNQQNALNFVFDLTTSEFEPLKKISSSYEEYRAYKWYLMNDWNSFIYLEQEGSLIYPDVAVFEERYELSRGCNYNVIFDQKKIDPTKKITFVFNDLVFGIGKIKFQFNMQEISKLVIQKTL